MFQLSNAGFWYSNGTGYTSPAIKKANVKLCMRRMFRYPCLLIFAKYIAFKIHGLHYSCHLWVTLGPLYT